MRIIGKMSTLIITLVLFMCSLGHALQREVEYAIEDAAFKTIRELNQRNVPVERIYFKGLLGSHIVDHIFRGGLLRVPGNYEFISSATIDEDGITSGDVIEDDAVQTQIGAFNVDKELSDPATLLADPETILTLQKIKHKQPEAILLGIPLESAIENGNGLFRVTMTLINIKTKALLWSGNIVGNYKKIEELGSVPKGMLKAAEDLGSKALTEYQNVIANLPAGNVYVLPLLGKNANMISDTVVNEMASAGNGKMAFFSAPPNPENNRFIHSVALELAGEGTALPNMRQITNILKQLDQVFDMGADGKKGTTVIESAKKENLYLTGLLKNYEEIKNKVKGQQEFEITVAFTLRNFKNNQILWGKTITGRHVIEDNITMNDKIIKFIKNNLILIIVASVVLVGLVFFKMTSQIR